MNRPANRFLDVAITASILLLGFGYYFYYRQLGWFMQDEGVLYYHYFRVYQGQFPYLDFFTGHPPMMHYFHALVFSKFGVSIEVIRTLMSVVNAVSAAALYAVTRRLAPRGLALIPPALFLVMQPGDLTNMDYHISPYPSWHALALVILGTWALLRFLEARGEVRQYSWLAITGLLGGLALLSKQNMGIYFLWGVTGFLFSHTGLTKEEAESEPFFGRLLRVGYLTLIPGSTVFLVKNFLGPATFGLFVVPLVILAAMGARQVFTPVAGRRLLIRLCCLALGFSLAFGPWFAYFSMKMGAGDYLRALFLLGTDLDLNLYLPFPPPGIPTLALLVPLAALGLLGWFRRRIQHGTLRSSHVSVVHPRRLLSLVGLVAAIVLGVVLAKADIIERLVHSEYGPGQIYIAVSTALDNILAYLCFILLGAALLIAWRETRTAAHQNSPSTAAFFCVLWVGTCVFLVYYPRMDSAHLVGAVPLLYPVAMCLIARGYARWTDLPAVKQSRFTRVAVSAVCLLALGFVIGTKALPKVYSRVMLEKTEEGFDLVSTPKEWLRFDRGEIYFPVYFEEHRRWVQEFGSLIRYIRATTMAEEPIFVFPSQPMIYFVSERDNPTRHDYFFGTNASYKEQLEVIRKLEQEQVDTVIMANNPEDYFVKKSRDFTRLIEDYLRRHYYFERRFGSYDVMRRYHVTQNREEGAG